MKYKALSVLLSLAVVMPALLAGCSGTDTEEEVIELTYNNFFSSTHYTSVLAEQWIAEIEERSEGRVDITYYSGGQLSPANQTYDAVTQGICDIGMSVFAYSPGKFPACELIDLPHGYPNGYVSTMVANDFYNEFKPAELDEVQPLYFHAPGPYVMFTSDKPIRTIEDLDGVILRATGVGTKILQALGASGYGGTQGEAYELISKGVVDGNYSTLESLKSWKQAEVVKYVTNCTDVGNTSMMFVVMNNDKWDSLPSDIQDIFMEVSAEFVEKQAMVWTYYDQSGLDYFNELADGREVIELTSEETAKWIEVAVDPLIETYVAEKTDSGLPASEYEEYVQERVEYWSANVPSMEDINSFVESEVAGWSAENN